MPDISISETDATVTVRIDGEMNIYHAAELKTPLLELLSKGKDIALDLSLVGDLDTSGLQILMLLSRELNNAGKTFTIIKQGEASFDALTLLNMSASLSNQTTDSGARHGI